MELLVFGHPGGVRVLVFPTRGGRFYDYEDWGLVAAQAEPLAWWRRQLYCLDSVDHESLYALHLSPAERLARHRAYEAYVREEVIPLTERISGNGPLWTHGCSLGAYHAVNFALRHPGLCSRAVGLSGRYNLTEAVGNYPALLDPQADADTYFQTPPWFIRGMPEGESLRRLRALHVWLGVGDEDVFAASNHELATTLRQKGLRCDLELWPGEAHRARYWRPALARGMGDGARSRTVPASRGVGPSRIPQRAWA
ncbi:MAG TPA: alpha/beta hydrolase-fold protein [Opitutaceae bacterium]